MSGTGANSLPIGRLNPILTGRKTFSGPSLLKQAHELQVQAMKRDVDQMEPETPHNYGGYGQFGLSLQQQQQQQMMSQYQKLMSTPPPGMQQSLADSFTPGSDRRKKKRKSRWGGDETEKTFIPGMPTILPSSLSPDQERAYLLQLQIEELSRRLRTGDLGISPNPEERSPSPEPIYNNEGKRLNTRDYRTRKRLEEERHNLIQEILKLNPEFKPPADYKPPMVRVSDKVMIPQDEHPDINFVGLLIGPRGNTLKNLEKDTGAKIIIRGKGSVKEGKIGRKDGQPLPGEDEPLHAYITANNPESVQKALVKIKDIIKQGIEVPEGQNDLRRMQLRELALLNGTLRENEGPRCTNCGANTHRSWQCPERPNITNNVMCTNCGGVGHIASDCREKRPGLGGVAAAVSATPFPGLPGADKSKIDEEYMSLMAELGEGPAPPPREQPETRWGAPVAQTTRPSLYSAPPGPASTGGPMPAMPNAGIRGPPPRMQMPPPREGAPPPPWGQGPASGPGQQHAGAPPPLMSQSVGPPWAPGQGSVMPVPPPSSGMGPSSGATAATTSGGGFNAPQPGLLTAPPPPPPNSQAGGGSGGGFPGFGGQSASPWQAGTVPPLQVNNPWPHGAPPPWQGMMGVPPPVPPPVGVGPPPPPPSSGAAGQGQQSGIDINILAAAGLPNLLAAPPPPPPS